MTNFLFKFKKPYFRPISQTIERKAFFLTTPVLSRTTSKGFLAACQNSEKSDDPIPTKKPEQTAGQKNIQTYFKGSF